MYKPEWLPHIWICMDFSIISPFDCKSYNITKHLSPMLEWLSPALGPPYPSVLGFLFLIPNCYTRIIHVLLALHKSILKEINTEYSLEGLKLKLQYFGHLMQGADSLEKTKTLGKIKGRRRRGWQRMRWWMASPIWGTWVWASSGSWWWTGEPDMPQCMGSQRVIHSWETELN